MKRTLTREEIENIIDFIVPNKCIPIKIANSLVKIHKNKLRKQLTKQMVYPNIIPLLKENLRKQFLTSIIEPGESVGVIASQSIGQKNTQSTLNTFHRCGQSESQVLTGVPRFQEILNATKSPKGPSCKIYLKDGFIDLEDVQKTIGYNLVTLNIKDIIDNISIDCKTKKESWYDIYDILYNDEDWYRKVEDYSACIKLYLKINVLYKYSISYIDIIEAIHNKFDDCYCIFSPDTIGEIHVYFDTREIKLDEDKLFINKDNYIDIYLEETVEPTLIKTRLFGIENISNIYFYQEEGEWIVDTDGSNFLEILLLPFVDCYKTISNDMWEIYDILGIEATRQYLIEELQNILEVNESHISILVSRMTFSGSISSISRYTMRKEKTGAISKSSFEETVDQFIRAATNGDVDDCTAVSSSIVCGNRPKFGTGMVDLKVDINSIIKNDIIGKIL